MNLDLPYDLQPTILRDVYKRGLPRVQKKILHKQNVNAIQNVIKKVNQICNYESFDKKSLLNQEKKLKDIFTRWLLFIGSQVGRPRSTSFVGPNNELALKNTLIELSIYWTNEDIQNYFCDIIKSINFKHSNQKTNAYPLMNNFIIDCNRLNMIKKDIIDDIIMDTVKNNRKNICKYLNRDLNQLLEY